MAVSNYESLMKICQRAMNGEEEAVQELGLTDVKVNLPKAVHLDKDTLQREYTQTATIAAAARRCSMNVLEGQCISTLSYILVLAKTREYKINKEVDPQDVAEVMMSLLDEEKRVFESEEDSQGDGAVRC